LGADVDLDHTLTGFARNPGAVVSDSAERYLRKLAATRRVLLLNSWIFLVAIGISVQAFVSGNYYLLIAGAILLTFVAPIAVQYLRLRKR
jgi:hypothetical protein